MNVVEEEKADFECYEGHFACNNNCKLYNYLHILENSVEMYFVMRPGGDAM